MGGETDKEVEQFTKCCQKAVDKWADGFGKLHVDFEALRKQLDDLKAKEKDPAPGDKEKVLKLKLSQEELQKILDKRGDDLWRELKKAPVPKKAPELELKFLPDIVREMVKRKGVPLSKNVTLKPEVDINIKKGEIKGGGVKLIWKF